MFVCLFADPVWVILHVAVAEDEGVLGLASQLSTITTREADMEADDTSDNTTLTAATRLEQGVAPNPFGSSPHSTPSSANAPASYQEHPFGSGSMMSGGGGGPGSIPMDAAYLERLLVQDQEATPPSPCIATNTPLDPIRASADSTTSCSVPVPQSQNQELEWKCSVVSAQNQTAEAGAAGGVCAGPAPMLGGGGEVLLELGGVSEGASCSMMDEGSTETS